MTKMKKNLNYETIDESGLLDDGKYRNRSVRTVVFRKENITYKAKIVSYTEFKTSKRGRKEHEVQLLTNSFDMNEDDVIIICL